MIERLLIWGWEPPQKEEYIVSIVHISEHSAVIVTNLAVYNVRPSTNPALEYEVFKLGEI